MRQNWFAATLGTITLAIGATVGMTWTPAGTSYAVAFKPPPGSASAPASPGGGTRGNSLFQSAPGRGSAPASPGGGTRGDFFKPTPGSANAPASPGGGTRGDFFSPAPGRESAPASPGGGTRGSTFTPPTNNVTPQGSVPGAAAADAQDGDLSRSNAYGVTYSPAGLEVPAMLAVMPESFYGTTLEARPTILVYAPASSASEAIFSIKDEAKNTLYQMVIAVPEQGGTMAIEIPAEAPELAVDRNYQWYVAMKLDNELSPASPFVNGWVKRIMPNAELTVALTSGDKLSNAEALGANGIWYDTVAQLATLQEMQNDEIISGHWYELLASVGLADIADAPIAMR